MAEEINLRSRLVDALTARLPADQWVIVGAADMPTRIEKRTVAAWAADIVPGGSFAVGYDLGMRLEVTTPHQDIRKADDDLDGALLAVLRVVFEAPWLLFERAERITNDDKTQHSWLVTLHQHLTQDTDPEEA